MANRVATPNLFAPTSPNWSLALLDSNAQAAAGAINDSSLGAANGPLADTGSVNAYSVTCAYGTPSAYNNGMTVFFTPANTNTGASTLTVAPLGSLPIVSASGSALAGGELVAGNTAGVVCDGSAFRIFSVPVTPLITAVRLRSFSAIGNPTFEVDQKQAGTQVVPGAIDRWSLNKNGTMVVGSGQIIPTVLPYVPGTNFLISRAAYLINLNTAQASLGAGDFIFAQQIVEGPMFRELSQDVHSISLLVYSSVAGLKFAVAIRDNPNTKSLVKLCTVPNANTWTLITLPNIPIWATGGNFSSAPGAVGYILSVCLASGSTYIAPTTDTWQNGNFIGASGMSNFAASAVNSQFIMAFIQHEPGAFCTTPIDLNFQTNYDQCLRHFQKTYDYGTAIGSATSNGCVAVNVTPSAPAAGTFRFVKPMAKTPTIQGYSPATGAAGNVRDVNAAVDRLISGAFLPGGSAGFEGFSLSTTNAAATFYAFHYTADTGW